MSLIPLRPLLEATVKYGFGQGAFNVNAVAQAKAAIEVHEMFRSAAILQGADLANGFMGGRRDFMNATLEDKKVGAKNIADAVKKYGADSEIPIVLHLDHGRDFDSCVAAIEGGYTSVMIDGSGLEFERNIAVSRKTAEAGAACRIPVEAELGKVGGKEDDGPDAGQGNPFTDPDEAEEFVRRTGCTSLAVGVGTAHGVYHGTPHIEQDILKAIRERVDVPLVLHGTSGVPDDTVRACIARGICKVNYATDLRIAFTKGVSAYLKEHPDAFDPKKYNAQGREEVKQYVMEKIKVCGSDGKA